MTLVKILNLLFKANLFYWKKGNEKVRIWTISKLS